MTLPSPADIPADAMAVLSYRIGRTLRAVPVTADDADVTVALADLGNLNALDDLQVALRGRRITPVAAEPAWLDEALQVWARREASLQERAAVKELAGTETDTVDEDDASDEGKMAQLVNQLLAAAITAGASDIHVEPTDRGLDVRFRVDGILRLHGTYPRSLTRGVINVIKVLADIDVSERRLPKDGRFAHTVAGIAIDCRVVTLPTAWSAEGAVIRILGQSRESRTLDSVAFSEQLAGSFRKALAVPHGAILVTGPTGSGKSTTLYAALDLIATGDRKAMAVEDPVEIRMPKITQVQVNEKAQLTFATALRSFLRADPDIILVGEIRDNETADLATQAALTGHLVLSTLHANEAAGAPTRLSRLGLSDYVTASALRAVLAQRLLRRLCPSCRIPYTPTDQQLVDAGWPDTLPRPQLLHQARPGGCLTCSKTGYSGRLAVGELMIVNDVLSKAIGQRTPSRELAQIAQSQGMIPIHCDALGRAASGETSLEEVARVGL